MSIASKQILLKNLETYLNEMLTVNQKNEVMIKLSNELQNFDVEATNYKDEFGSDYLKEFLSAKTIEGCSKKTIERYEYILNRMFKDIQVSIRSITVFHLRQYLASERERGISDRTLDGYRSVFSSFFSWLYNEGLIDKDPSSNLGIIKCAKVVRKSISDVEFELLKAACSTIRDRAIVCFLMSTGCRISELCSLNRRDIDYTQLRCKVLGKGNKERIVYIDTVTAMNLKKYEKDREDLSDALFVGKNSDRLTPGGIRRMLNETAKKAGLKEIHPHKFRRTLATNLIEHGMPIQDVARILGHENLDTTMKYVCMNDELVHASYKKYS